jgi:hypothetical protein
MTEQAAETDATAEWVVSCVLARYCYGEEAWAGLDPEERNAVSEPYLPAAREIAPMLVGAFVPEALRGLARDPHARAVLSKAFREAPMANAAEALHALADDLAGGENDA